MSDKQKVRKVSGAPSDRRFHGSLWPGRRHSGAARRARQLPDFRRFHPDDPAERPCPARPIRRQCPRHFSRFLLYHPRGLRHLQGAARRGRGVAASYPDRGAVLDRRRRAGAAHGLGRLCDPRTQPQSLIHAGWPRLRADHHRRGAPVSRRAMQGAASGGAAHGVRSRPR